ncbi:MAG TPA: sigma-54 dependent transcriptional regulator [Nitrospirota bacterium]|nr:sigma-54 dependent transcriptional regulator [Nitrospirota bacterium]
MGQILIVDDDRNHLKVLKGLIEKTGTGVVTAADVDSALSLIDTQALNAIITDLKMPGKSGMDLLTYCRERKPAVPVIMITAHGDIETAVAAMKLGAYDFITKPIDEHELVNAVQKALAESEKNRELVSAYFDTESGSLPEVIGKAPAIEQILQTARKIAPSDSTVLISGETGVGKELIAKTIHLASGRRDKPFVKVNCAAIPETLAESELFGYERGAFTGAVTSKPGRFEIAHEGTIFLDEIGDMPLQLQSRLLGVLQDKSFERVGGVKTIKADVRILAATNRDLQADVQTGKFRADLFYRLNVVPIRIPPLRERKDDIVPLLDHFLKKFASRHAKRATHVLSEVAAAFVHYDWPGNIRELENAVERMVLMSDGDVIGLDQVPQEIQGATPVNTSDTLKEKIAHLSSASEKQMILDALNKTKQNRTKAAELLGISRRTLQNKIKEYGL